MRIPHQFAGLFILSTLSLTLVVGSGALAQPQSLNTDPQTSDQPGEINALVARLQADDAKVRAHAAAALGNLAVGDVDVAKALSSVAFDSDSEVRAAVVSALVKIKAPRELTMPIWLKTLSGQDQEAIMQLVGTMVDLGSDAIPALRETLGHPEIGYWACLIASEIGPDAGPLAPELLKLINHAEPEVQLQATIALGKIQGDGPTIVLALAELLEGDTPLATKYAACYAISQYDDQPVAVDALRSTFKSATDPELKLLSAWSLLTVAPKTPHRDATVATIIAGLSSDQPRQRALAVRALGSIPLSADGPSVKVIEAMIQSLQNSDDRVIAEVVDQLAAKGTASLPVIRTGLGVEKLRPHAVELARRLGPAAAPVVPQLAKALTTSNHPELRREITYALAAIGPDASGATDALATALSDKNQQVRTGACYALGQLGPAAESARPDLRRCTQGNETFLRLSATWSLLKIAPDNPKVAKQSVPLLVSALSHPDENVRAEAARILGTLGSIATPVIEPLTATATNDKSSAVRTAATEALSKIK